MNLFGFVGTLENFRKFATKLQKMHYFSLFFNKFQNNAFNFCVFGRKTQFGWEIFEKLLKKFLMKIQYKNGIFIYFREKLLLKIEPSEITPFFYNNFFRLGGGWTPPNPPAYATLYKYPLKESSRNSNERNKQRPQGNRITEGLG